MTLREEILGIRTTAGFESVARKVLSYQLEHLSPFKRYVDLLGLEADYPHHIPFFPISFFKELDIIASGMQAEKVFSSSRTTGQTPSRHPVADLSLYRESLLAGFEIAYGSPEHYTMLALLPSYLERDDASLVYMMKVLMDHSSHPLSGFFMNDLDALHERIMFLLEHDRRFILIGVPFALLDLLDKHTYRFDKNILIETGGMKGRRREMIRAELHQWLCAGFGLDSVHSEYGMTELLSQAWSIGKGIYQSPPWMKVTAYDINDPQQPLQPGESGRLNIIDLANLHSCSFIATDDVGRVRSDGTFEVLGRVDNSDVRGCNLLAI
ncbi:MAG: acyl transferase [Bacteroidota bacterium]